MDKEENINYGFTQVRTARTISAVIAMMGMVLLLIQRVLVAVLGMANEALGLAFARYSNFTGRFAAQNFAEDKKLLALLKEVKGIMPIADTAVTVLLVCSIVLLVIALVGLALPRQFSHILVAAKLLKWSDGSEDKPQGTSLGRALSNLGNIPVKKLIIPIAGIGAIVGIVLVVVSYADKIDQVSYDTAIDEMQEQAMNYITAQRSYFAKNSKIGGPKALQLPDSLQSEFFTYKVSGSRFTATTSKPMGKCPAGTKWTVSAEAKGFFTQELNLYRIAPKDSSCAKLSPEFKQLGRKKKQATTP